MAKLDGYYAVAEIEEGCYGMKYFLWSFQFIDTIL